MHKFLANLFFLLFATQIASAQTTDKTEFRLKSEKSNVAIDDIFKVKVEVKNFKNMLGFQWGLSWKSEDYDLILVETSSSLPKKSGYNANDKGIFRVLWYDSTAVSKNLIDNTTIFTLTYIANRSGKVEDICFSANAIDIEVVKGDTGPIITLEQSDFIGLGCGFTWSRTASGVKTITDLKTTTGTKEVATLESHAYPNPFFTNFYIQNKFQNADNVSVTIFDLLGKVVLEQQYDNVANDENIAVNASNLAIGQYIYTLKTSNGVSTGKIAKQ